MEWVNTILNLDSLIPPSRLTLSEWFKILVLIGGTYVAVMYMLFAYFVLKPLRNPLRKAVQTKFPLYLGLVFILCAFTHFIHSLGYMTQYISPLLLVIYPFLVYYHSMLLVTARNAIKDLMLMKTPNDIKSIVNENMNLQKDKAKLERLIAYSYTTKDFKQIKDYLREHELNT